MNKNTIKIKPLSRMMCKTIGLLAMLLLINFTAAAQQPTVTLSFNNTEIRAVLKQIKAQTNFDFLYNNTEINEKALVTVNVKNADLETALKACFDQLNIEFTIKDRIIILQKASLPAPTAAAAQPQQAPRVQIRGVVVDGQKEPLPGVTVKVKDSNTGVATNAQGRFILALTGIKNPELVFTSIGMKPVTYKVTNENSEIRIVMQESQELLSEVVITGMEVINRAKMTGTASVLTAKDLKMQGVTSIDRVLDGMVAGLNSTTLSGAPGTRTRITIRGENNLSKNTEPLWILDGLPMLSGVPTNNSGNYAETIMQDGVGNIMPEDIESISILKDASAAAIYGARAANGVIVITTKKGFRSKTQINYTGTLKYGLAPRNNMNFMNSAQKLRYEKSIVDIFGLPYAESAGYGGYLYRRMLSGYITPAAYNQEIERLSGTNTNWFDVLFRPAVTHSHNLSLRGGSEELTYYTAVNFQDEQGILRPNRYQNAGVLINLDYRPTKKLIMGLKISANTRQNQNHASAQNPFRYAVFANPYERPYDENGNYAADLSFLSDNYTTRRASGYLYENFNILREMEKTRSTQSGLDADITFNLRYDIIPGLSVESIFRKGVSFNSGIDEVDAGTYTSWASERFGRAAYPSPLLMPDQFDNGQLSENSGKNNSWSIRNQLDYSLRVKESHLFSFLFANEVTSRNFNNFGYTSPIYYQDYRITGIPLLNADFDFERFRGTVGSMFNTNDGQDRSVSFVGNMRYDLKERYVVNFNFRADGADVIGNINRFTPLWSVGFRYNLHKEKFFKGDFIDKFINEISLRGSYGFTGNIDRSAYPFSTIELGSGMYMGNRYATGFSYPNPTVRWERKKDRNIGIDMMLFKNRVALSANYYSNRVDDILENLNVPNSTGRTSVKANGGIITNSGMEINADVRWISTPDWVFSTSANVAMNKNVILRSNYTYATFSESIASGASRGGQINLIGQETGSIYGWAVAGINPQTGNPMYYLTEEGKTAYARFLDAWDSYSEWDKQRYLSMIPSLTSIPDFVDFDKSNSEIMKYFMPSMQYLGRSNPKYVGGFSSYLRCKGIEFTTSWTYKLGSIIPNFNDYQNAPGGSGNYSSDLAVSGANREVKYLYFWQAPGDVTNISRFVPTSGDGRDYWAGMQTSEKYSSGDYLRMTNLSLSYRLPVDMIEKWKLKSMSIGLSVRNLLTFTKYRGLDVGTGGAFSYPVSREYNLRLSVGF